MYKTKRLLALLLSIAMLLGLFGCSSSGTEPTTVPTEAPTEPPVSERYTLAAEPFRTAQNLAIDLTTKKVIDTGAESLELVSKQELILTDIGGEAFTASLSEELELNGLTDEFTEYYKDGLLYVNVYDIGFFQGKMAQTQFLERFAPAVLLDETLYATIAEEQTDAGFTITFSDPSAPENWALPAGAEFVQASGSAKITDNGTLTRTTYTIEYTQGNNRITMEVSAKAEVYDDAAPEAPSDPSVYKTIDSIEAPRIYDTAVLYMYGADTASTTVNQTIVSQAADYVQTEKTELHYTGVGKEHVSDVQYTVTSMNSALASDTFSQTERFQDGLYTYTAENSNPETDSEITWEDMRFYLQGHYDNNVPALAYISSIKAEYVSGLVYLEMALDEDWGQAMADYTCELLFQDSNFLNNYASEYQTTGSSFYMAVDPATGFPISSSIAYSGQHTIDGINYVLSSENSQSYRFADFSTYETLMGESAPETSATPLLYHVTGSEGQELYLMGTIHVGDSRTAFLPEAVYDALDAADALAVEADIMTIEQQVQENPETAVQFAALCINPDGTATKDLLESDVYDKAVTLLKLSGNYNSTIEYMKPYMWSSSIEDFYLTLGSISSEKGVDRRLLELAAEKEKKVLEVESVLAQMEILMNLSPELQAYLLEDALGYTAAEYNKEIQDLFEAWCTGDEAVLRKLLNEDTSLMTEEEKALYQEYLDAIIIRRNTAMLEAATSYLESGDTVFYAVGLAHLLQENGLVDTLREAGYTVEQIQYQ